MHDSCALAQATAYRSRRGCGKTTDMSVAPSRRRLGIIAWTIFLLFAGSQRVHASCRCIDTSYTRLLGAQELVLDNSGLGETERGSRVLNATTSTCTTDTMHTCETRCALAGYPLYAADNRVRCHCAWSYMYARPSTQNSVSSSAAVCVSCKKVTREKDISCQCGATNTSLWVCSASNQSLSVVSRPVVYVGCYEYDSAHLRNQTIPTVLAGRSVATFTYHDAPTELASPAVCATYCKLQSDAHSYAAIGNYWHCTCGATLRQSAQRKNSSKCMPCAGDPQMKCGISNSMAVYEIVSAHITAYLGNAEVAEDSTLRPGQVITLACNVQRKHAQNVTGYMWNCSQGESLYMLQTSRNITVMLDSNGEVLLCRCFANVSQISSGASVFAIAQYSLNVMEVNVSAVTATVGDIVTLQCDSRPCVGGFPFWRSTPFNLSVWSLLVSNTVVASKSRNGSTIQCVCSVQHAVLSQVVMLVADFPGHIYAEMDSPYTVLAGENTTLSCIVNTTSADLTVSWHWQSTLNDTSGKAVKMTSHGRLLHLVNVDVEDRGLYVCRAKRNGVVVLRTHVIVIVEETRARTVGSTTQPSTAIVGIQATASVTFGVSSPMPVPTVTPVHERPTALVVPSTEDGAEESYFSGNNLITLAIIAALVVIICLLVAFIAVSRSRRNSRDAENAQRRVRRTGTPEVRSEHSGTAQRRHATPASVRSSRQPQQPSTRQEDASTRYDDRPPSHQPVSTTTIDDNARGGENEVTDHCDDASNSSFCISPLPSGILVQIGLLEDCSLAHTYTSVPVDSETSSKTRVIGRGSRHVSSSSSTSSSVTHEYDQLRYSKLEEMLIQPYQPPPDSETAIYSHLKHRGYRRIETTDIELGGEIGSGHFGVIRSGWWVESQSGRRVPVAVKTMREDLSLEKRVEFLREAAIMGQFRHRNIAFLYGVVTTAIAKEIMLVLELLDPINLREYLQGLSISAIPRSISQQLLRHSCEIAEGMAYLAAKSFVHRDLAARNILRGMDGICKISDFGLSCEIDDTRCYRGSGRLLPIRWTAPETLSANKFSTSSDVWSFGVLLYEIWSVGKRPYHLWSNEKVIEEVKNGYRLPKPSHCPLDIYEVMTDCWNINRHHRPTFRTIVPQLSITDMGSVLWTAEPFQADSVCTRDGCTAAPESNLRMWKGVDLASPSSVLHASHAQAGKHSA